jgi:copper chaperone CopZ
MFRRQFVQLFTLVGAGSLTALTAGKSGETRTLTYRVKGFSCVTCAVGLDAMLERQRGVKSSRSAYPQGSVTVRFDPNQITDSGLRTFIADSGFTVEQVLSD